MPEEKEAVEETTQDPSLLGDAELDEMLGEDTIEQEEEEPTEPKETAEADEIPGEEQEAQEVDYKSEFEKLKAERETLTKRIADKDKFIARQATEVGKLRKQVKPKYTKDEINEKFMEDPDEALRMREENQNPQDDISPEELEMMVEVNKSVVESEVPDFLDYVDAIADLAREEGLSEKNIDAFKKNPYVDDPNVLMRYYNRVKEKSEISKALERLKILEEENAELKKSREEVVKKIEKTARETKDKVSAKTGGSIEKKSLSHNLEENSVHLLTDKQLEDLLAETQ